MTAEQKSRPVRVQWDPERDIMIQTLPYRSIQIGVSGDLGRTWSSEWIVGIEDVTERARAMKKAIDEDSNLSVKQMIDLGLMPVERPYPLPKDLQETLKMSMSRD